MTRYAKQRKKGTSRILLKRVFYNINPSSRAGRRIKRIDNTATRRGRLVNERNGRKEGKGNFGGGKVAFVKAPEFRVGYLRGQPHAGPFYYAPMHFSLGYVGLFTRCFGGSEANWWRPQGGIHKLHSEACHLDTPPPITVRREIACAPSNRHL
jgi:hypothetical protein